MSRWIEVDALRANINTTFWSEIGKIIDSAPSIDIVRCGECKYSDGEPPIADGRTWCVIHGSFMYYCSDGKREGE